MAERSATLIYRNDEPGEPAFEGILIDVAPDMTADEIVAARLCPARVIRRPDGTFMQMPIDLDDHQIFEGVIDEREDGSFVLIAPDQVSDERADHASARRFSARLDEEIEKFGTWPAGDPGMDDPDRAENAQILSDWRKEHGL
jgi:hypothetical protein